jgi:hypothetical protein
MQAPLHRYDLCRNRDCPASVIFRGAYANSTTCPTCATPRDGGVPRYLYHMSLVSFVTYLFTFPEFCAALPWWYTGRNADPNTMSDLYDGEIWDMFKKDPQMKVIACMRQLGGLILLLYTKCDTYI